MALLRTLALLERGERINDQMLRSTLRRGPRIEVVHLGRVNGLLRQAQPTRGAQAA